MLNRLRSRFAPRLLPTLTALAAVLLFAALGNWQLGRAEVKRALAADFTRTGPALELGAPSEGIPRYQRVTVRGHYDPARQFLLDNMSHAGRPGVQVLTPLRLADGSAVLVNRGWQPFGATRQALPDVAVTDWPRRVTGRLDELPRPPVALDSPPASGWPRLVQFPRAEELSTALGRELHPRMILLDPDQPDGYVRDWTIPGTTPERHLGYAVQWFALAALAIAIWFATSLRRPADSA